jgi:hypothetical protein
MRTAKKRGPGPSHLLLTPDHAGNVVGIDPHKRTLTATVVDPRAAAQDPPDEDPLDSLVRRVLLAMLEERRTRQPGSAPT